MAGTNWAGNHTYRARRLHRPHSLDELSEIVAGAERIRAVGTRHSFNAIADSDEQVSVECLPPEVEIGRGTVSFAAGMTYGALAPRLHEEGLALHSMASLPHISVAGAVATASHGSGDLAGNLATAVVALELVTSDGGLRRFERGGPEFEGAVVGLGRLGVVTRLTLAVEPAYDVRQRVLEGLPWEALRERFGEITACGQSVSVFTLWGEDAGAVWVKDRGEDRVPADRFGAREATGERHPLPGIDPVHTTPQVGVPGPWFERLPHFRMGFTPSSGEELQSEYLLPRAHAVDAIAELRGLAPVVRPVLLTSEIRTIAADALWMSPMYGRETVGIHFTWKPDPEGVDRAMGAVERALAPFDPRPHPGKLHHATPADLERAADFDALAEQLDPRGAFA